MKIVVNRCYGGFGLSDAAVRRYAEIRGIPLYPEERDKFGLVTYFTVPPDQRGPFLEGKAFQEAPFEERKASNDRYDAQTLSPRDIPRNDPVLVQVVEEMGGASSGDFAELAITEIPDDVDWEIEEYDGREWVSEKHRTW